jgi:hypothetical protein
LRDGDANGDSGMDRAGETRATGPSSVSSSAGRELRREIEERVGEEEGGEAASGGLVEATVEARGCSFVEETMELSSSGESVGGTGGRTVLGPAEGDEREREVNG